ncbi:hypothetical protein AVEN_34534-1 [Araneus ventricosus]|uniref:Uncharacterized protein n=1 Tax=Araneus ventricosus TaxID=182803 RepID=A0A4Y2U5L5_ARAVE|nr:hypothetical protein AVEN_34534-1 [Araneus ventricosus]
MDCNSVNIASSFKNVFPFPERLRRENGTAKGVLLMLHFQHFILCFEDTKFCHKLRSFSPLWMLERPCEADHAPMDPVDHPLTLTKEMWRNADPLGRLYLRALSALSGDISETLR